MEVELKVYKMKSFNLILIIFLISGCTSNNEKILLEASEIHDQSLEIEKEVNSKFDSLKQTSNSINIQGRALTEEEIKFTREVELLGLSLDYWQENHLEVPSSDQLNKKDENTVYFSAQDILMIQKEFNDSLVALRARLNKVKMPQ